jgi:hypothetical protein
MRIAIGMFMAITHPIAPGDPSPWPSRSHAARQICQLDEQGPPPQVIRLRLGNCSNAALPGSHVLFGL